MLKHLILVTLLFQFIFSLNCDSFDEDERRACLIAEKIKKFYQNLSTNCLINKELFRPKLKNFVLNLKPEIELKNDYEQIIDEEIKKNQIYLTIYQNKSFKQFFDLIKQFITKIEKVVAKARGDTHNDEYFRTICKFLMEFMGLDETNCD